MCYHVSIDSGKLAYIKTSHAAKHFIHCLRYISPASALIFLRNAQHEMPN